MNNTTSLTKMHHEMIKLRERLAKAEAELKELREQKPIKDLYRVTDCFGHDVLRDDPKGATILETIPLYAAPVATPAVPAPSVPEEWRAFVSEVIKPLRYAGEYVLSRKASALLQSAQDAPSVPESAIAGLIKAAWEWGVSCGDDDVRWGDAGDSYNQMLRDRTNNAAAKLRALLQSADHSEKSLEMVTPEFRNSAKDQGICDHD